MSDLASIAWTRHVAIVEYRKARSHDGSHENLRDIDLGDLYSIKDPGLM